MWKCDCRFLPHGLYSLLPATLSLMGFWVTIVQDGCDYAKLSGPSVEDITESDIIPYLEVGFAKGYRAPLYYADDEEWKMVYTNECKEYPTNLEPDSLWNMAKWCTLLSSIFGLSGTLFLWFTVCFAYSARTWRLCAVQLLLAALTRLGTIAFLFTDMCTTDGSTCSLHFGSRCDLLATTLWLVSAVMIFGYYPTPKLKSLTEKEFIEQTLQEQQEALSALQENDSRSVISGATRSVYTSAKRLASGGGRSSKSFASRGGGGDDQTYYTSAGQSFYTKGGNDNRSFYTKDQSFYTKGDDRSVDNRSFYTKDQSFYTKGGDQTYYDDKSFYTKGEGDDQTYYTNYADEDRSVGTRSYYTTNDQQTRYHDDDGDDGQGSFV